MLDSAAAVHVAVSAFRQNQTLFFILEDKRLDSTGIAKKSSFS